VLRASRNGNVNTDLSSATAAGLIENIRLGKRVFNDLFRWMSQETFEGREKLFRYHLCVQEYKAFSAEFHCKQKVYSGPSRL